MANLILHFLTCTSTRLFVLRFVVVSSIAATVYTSIFLARAGSRAGPKRLVIVPALITNIHHLGSAFGPRCFPIRQWMDIPLTVLEAGYYVFMVAECTDVTIKKKVNYGLIPREVMLAIIAVWTVSISLFSLLLLKIVEVSRMPKKSWTDIVDIAKTPTSPWWKYPAFAIFGRKLWGAQVPGEARWLAFLRGGISIAAIAVLVAFGLYQVIALPITENGLVPNRQFRTRLLPDALGEAEENANWTALVLWDRRENATMGLSDAVQVRWAFRNKKYATGDPLCHNLSQIETACGVGRPAYQCVRSQPYYPEGLNCAKLGQAFLQSIHVTINFTGLFDPEVGYGTQAASIYNAARIYIGLAEEAEKIVEISRPIHLYPGSHLLSVVDVLVRQRIRSPALATFGFEDHDTNLMVDPTYTITNPFVNTSHGLDTATLTITKEPRKREWTIIQDYRSKSVLDGLSSTGGLGSFLSTLIVIFLGTTLMGSVMRRKDYSPFGLLHTGMEAQMEEASHEKYPALERDIESYQQNPGIGAYILDTLVDMGPIGYHETGSQVKSQELGAEEHHLQLLAEGDDRESGKLVSRDKRETDGEVWRATP